VLLLVSLVVVVLSLNEVVTGAPSYATQLMDLNLHHLRSELDSLELNVLLFLLAVLLLDLLHLAVLGVVGLLAASLAALAPPVFAETLRLVPLVLLPTAYLDHWLNKLGPPWARNCVSG
jgi:hypothetical protein